MANIFKTLSDSVDAILNPPGAPKFPFDNPAPDVPTNTGFASRQASIKGLRPATVVRNIIRWLVPQSGMVEMYVNPQSIQYSFTKQITHTRTKGGYVVQYWGEELPTLTIAGTTGSSGVEGINVLYDVYRAEQLAFDPYALALEADQSRAFNPVSSDNAIVQAAGALGDIIADANRSGITTTNRVMPTLAQLALTVEMYYSGWVFRGYFKSFSFTESVQHMGLFDYNINFVVTQRRGWRENFFGWHRSATDGPSNSDIYGPKHSYNGLAEGFNAPRYGSTANPNLSGTGTATGLEQANSPLIKF